MKPLSKKVSYIVKKNNLDEHIIDHTLTEEEQLNFLKSLGYTDKQPTQKEEFFSHIEGETKRRIEEEMEKLKEGTQIDVYYQELYDVLQTFKENSHFNVLILSGRPAQGKSHQIETWVARNNLNFAKFNGHITPFQLYHILYYHSQSNEWLVFDDSNPILENVSSVSLLLQAGETKETRVVMWNTSKPSDAPQNFTYDGKIIIISNKNFEDIDEALQSRAMKYELNFDNEKMLLMIKCICKEDRILNLLKENVFRVELNLRVFKLIETVFYVLKNRNQLEKFELLGQLMIDMEINPNLRRAYDILKETGKIRSAVSRFMEETGCSRRSFYNYRQRIEILYGI